jgi:hypothetical protein
MLRTIAVGAALGCMSAQALILLSNPVASMTISRCTRSPGGTLVCQPACPVQGQSGDAARAPLPGTLASLLAEGYEIVHIVVPGGGRIILRKKKWSYTPTYICDRGPIGSPADESFMTCKYDQVSCSLAPDGYP